MIISKAKYEAICRETSKLLAENARIKAEKEQVVNSNITLLKKNRELKRKLDEITMLATCNTYNDETSAYRKIKELVRPANQN